MRLARIADPVPWGHVIGRSHSLCISANPASALALEHSPMGEDGGSRPRSPVRPVCATDVLANPWASIWAKGVKTGLLNI